MANAPHYELLQKFKRVTIRSIGKRRVFEAMQAFLMEPESVSLVNWSTMELKRQ